MMIIMIVGQTRKVLDECCGDSCQSMQIHTQIVEYKPIIGLPLWPHTPLRPSSLYMNPSIALLRSFSWDVAAEPRPVAPHLTPRLSRLVNPSTFPPIPCPQIQIVGDTQNSSPPSFSYFSSASNSTSSTSTVASWYCWYSDCAMSRMYMFKER